MSARRALPRRAPWWSWVLLVLMVVSVVAIPLGGWQRVDRADAAAERREPGERHVGDQFAATLDRAAVLPVRPGSSLDPEPGVASLVVFARLENRIERTQLPPTDLLVLDEGLGLGRADSVVLVLDPSGVAELQPGLPADVAFVWEIDQGVVQPDDLLRVGVVDRTAHDSQLTAGTVWLDPRVGAVADLEVGVS